MTSEEKKLIAKITVKDGAIDKLSSVGDVNRVFIFHSNAKIHSISSATPVKTQLLDPSEYNDGSYALIDNDEATIGNFEIEAAKVAKFITTDDDFVLIGTLPSNFQVFSCRPVTILDIDMFASLDNGEYYINET